MKMLRTWTAVALVSTLALFTLQNFASVEITFLFWTFETRRSFMILTTFVLGLAVGWLINSLQHRRRRTHEATHH